MNKGLEMRSWFEIVDQFKNCAMKLQPNVNFDELIRFLKMGQPLYYAAVVPNFVASLSLLCIGICILHKYKEYETQE
jgi:hypothetical protein